MVCIGPHLGSGEGRGWTGQCRTGELKWHLTGSSGRLLQTSAGGVRVYGSPSPCFCLVDVEEATSGAWNTIDEIGGDTNLDITSFTDCSHCWGLPKMISCLIVS